tara:strand:+ start:178 stop:642 length:465 start_codon:yes stop_codon:yes gene_type:complete
MVYKLNYKTLRKVPINEEEIYNKREIIKSNNYIMLLILLFVLFLIFYVAKKFFNNINRNQKKNLKKFLSTYDILGIFIGWTISSAGRDLSSSVIDNIIMPLLSPVFNYGDWKESTTIGPFSFNFGQLISELINFLFTVVFVYFVYLFIMNNKMI